MFEFLILLLLLLQKLLRSAIVLKLCNLRERSPQTRCLMFKPLILQLLLFFLDNIPLFLLTLLLQSLLLSAIVLELCQLRLDLITCLIVSSTFI